MAKPVAVVDDEIRKLARNMAETMYAAPGVGLAATQVDVPQAAHPDRPLRNPRRVTGLIQPHILESRGKPMRRGLPVAARNLREDRARGVGEGSRA